jgi:hypothetical protein
MKLAMATTPRPGAGEIVRAYPRLLDPREHPDYSRRAVRPPNWETFGGRTHFTCLRSFEVKEGGIVGFVEEIEKYTRAHELGDVIWPSYPILFASNLGELADEIARRGLFLFDIWGYVPGSGPGGYWQQFKVPRDALALLEEKLGDRWFGTDIGEQDGRYIHGYAGQMTPASAGRLEQYFNFQRHFERMGDDLGHRHATLVSLNFGHYLLKEGTCTLIGAETAQALPNSQVYYAFIRGAGKQYGVPWFGNASVYNRWGYKTYGPSGTGSDGGFGPTKGASLSLMKRLLYTHVLYNSVIVGFEAMWLEGDRLTPIGAVQQAAQRWVRVHGQPGVMHTPVALMLDFLSGWSFPRHLYAEKIYRVWGNLPYGEGDFLTDAILDLLYPGYQDASYFHDERGFQAATPFGDIADCVLSDAPGWLLARYPVLVVAGELGGGREMRDKLERYAGEGGHLVMTAANLAKLPGGLAGRERVTGSVAFEFGRGRITLFARAFGVRPAEVMGPLTSEIDRALPKPFVLDDEVRRGLGEIFRGQSLFEVTGAGLSFVTGRKAPGDYTLGIANNSWRESEFRITSRAGEIESIRELPIDDAEKAAAGYLPEGVGGTEIGTSGADCIAGGDIRIFSVKVREAGVAEIAHVAPAARPRGRLLTLRQLRSIKEAVLSRPTFFAHFDGVVVDWRYVHEREMAAVEAEAGWIGRQGLRVAVDLSSAVNFYPTLRLVGNVAADYAASMATVSAVLGKMAALGARDLILSLHRQPENNFPREETEAGFERTLRAIAVEGEGLGATLHLRLAPNKPPAGLREGIALIDRVGRPSLKLAPALSLLVAEGVEPMELGPVLAGKIGFWLCAAPRRDAMGGLCDANAPMHSLEPGDLERARRWLGVDAGSGCVLDAILGSHDAEYLDACVLAAQSAQPEL